MPYLLLVILSAIAYLPHITQLTYYRDDWYYIADRFFGGADIFHQMYWVDRPIRGYIYELLYQAFGLHPLPYNLLAYFWRLLSGVLCYWLFIAIWPAKQKIALWIALIFTLYPGYLWWVSGIEYQPYIISLCLQVFSLLLTVLAIQKSYKWWTQALLVGGAILTGWLYILIVDFAIGIELFRLVAVILLIQRLHPDFKFREMAKKLINSWSIYLLIPLGFVAYRVFLFQNHRPETDIALQLSGLKTAPLSTIATWISGIFQSFINVTVRGWLTLFNMNFFTIDNRERIIVVSLGIAMAIILAGLLWQRKNEFDDDYLESPENKWILWAFLGGVMGVLGTTVPIVLMNRTILIENASHYTLSGSLAAALMVVSLVSLVKPEGVRLIILIGLAGLALVSQQSHLLNVIKEEEKVQQFWQQVVVRIPDLEEGTTVLVNYPEIKYGDDYDIVWGPLNFAYLNQEHAKYYEGAVHYPFAGLKQNYLVSKDVLVGASEGDWYRTHAFIFNYSKLLILSQPTKESCVHVMDLRWPRLTLQDPDQVLLLADKSNINVVATQGTQKVLNPVIFGNADVQTWCSFYEKAELAVQQADWQRVLEIKTDAEKTGDKPRDEVEWMPFLQAAMFTGDKALVTSIAEEFTNNAFLKNQACALIPAMRESGFELDTSMVDLGRTLFCDQGSGG